MSNKLIMFDLDGVLANFTRGFTRVLHRRYGTPVIDDTTVDRWNFWEMPILGLSKEEVRLGFQEIAEDPTFWRDLDPLNPSIMNTIDNIENKVFITRRNGKDIHEQCSDWLWNNHISKPNVIVVDYEKSKQNVLPSEQSLVAVIDDNYTNCVELSAQFPNAFVAMMTTAHNVYTHNPFLAVNTGDRRIVYSVDQYISECEQRGLIEWNIEKIQVKKKMGF